MWCLVSPAMIPAEEESLPKMFGTGNLYLILRSRFEFPFVPSSIQLYNSMDILGIYLHK